VHVARQQSVATPQAVMCRLKMPDDRRSMQEHDENEPAAEERGTKFVTPHDRRDIARDVDDIERSRLKRARPLLSKAPSRTL